jgi:hypothetical protein
VDSQSGLDSPSHRLLEGIQLDDNSILVVDTDDSLAVFIDALSTILLGFFSRSDNLQAREGRADAPPGAWFNSAPLLWA